MNADDLEIWRRMTVRAAAMLQQLKKLANGGPDSSGEVLAVLDGLETDVAALTHLVQDRVSRAWRPDHRPRQPAPRHLHGPQSSDLAHGVAVSRFDLTGRRANEVQTRPPTSGKWAQWRGLEKTGR